MKSFQDTIALAKNSSQGNAIHSRGFRSNSALKMQEIARKSGIWPEWAESGVVEKNSRNERIFSGINMQEMGRIWLEQKV